MHVAILRSVVHCILWHASSPTLLKALKDLVHFFAVAASVKFRSVMASPERRRGLSPSALDGVLAGGVPAGGRWTGNEQLFHSARIRRKRRGTTANRLFAVPSNKLAGLFPWGTSHCTKSIWSGHLLPLLPFFRAHRHAILQKTEEKDDVTRTHEAAAWSPTFICAICISCLCAGAVVVVVVVGGPTLFQQILRLAVPMLSAVFLLGD